MMSGTPRAGEVPGTTFFSTEPYWGAVVGLSGGSQPRVHDTLFDGTQVGGTAVTVRGVAIRSWKGLAAGVASSGGSLVIEDLRFYQPSSFDRFSMPSWNGSSNAGTNPPATGSLVTNRTLTIHEPKWKARRWDTWSVVIPFETGQSFVVDPTKPLGIWIKVAGSPTASLFVDAVADGSGSPYMSNIDTASPFGHAIIFGLIPGTTQTLSPVLDVYGFPRVAEDVLFQVRSAGAGTTAVVQLGFSNPGNLVGSCRRLTSVDFTTPSLPAVVTSLLGDAAVPFAWPNDPTLLHRHVFAQASITSAGGTTYTNGLRMTLGGVVP